ncbi:hypothetical protein BD293_4598 [Roseinatronobacter monicus]|uniref:Uncharacterized protein n=1 Tax=Roseinatronobacter monicus TaxID=393481 RepID=A0A543K3C3_9RHOB|nr:hypothetical protein BD293_4598 [Roseinatronobacter monicus]
MLALVMIEIFYSSQSILQIFNGNSKHSFHEWPTLQQYLTPKGDGCCLLDHMPRAQCCKITVCSPPLAMVTVGSTRSAYCLR